MTKREHERLASLESDVAEIKADVKLLLAAHHRQNGFVTAVGIFGTAIGGALAVAWDWLTK